MEIIITPAGVVRAVYSEQIPLESLGPLTITRASAVEPTAQGTWMADLAAVSGPALGPFARRSQALAAEETWLRQYWLFSPGDLTCAGSLPDRTKKEHP